VKGKGVGTVTNDVSRRTLGVWLLAALVVGNMVGSGIFMLPRTLAEKASPAGVLLAWLMTGAGVLMSALVFGNLALRKPDLTGGPQAYARALFPGRSFWSVFSGYAVAWGYWVANFGGNVAIITTFAGYLSTFFPIMTSQAVIGTLGPFVLSVGNVLTFAVCSAFLWGIHFLILRGMEGAGKTNFVATAAKVAGFLLFLIAALFAFDAGNLVPFGAPRTDETGQVLGLWEQVNQAAVATLWAFVGVESAVVFSGRARRPRDVKTATLVGLLVALALYIAITFLVMGVLPHERLVASDKPLVDTLSAAVGPSGAYLLAVLGLISLFGSSIGWIWLSAEVPYQAAKQGLFLSPFLRENRRGAPTVALTATNVMAQLFLLSTLSQSVAKAFDFVIHVATLAYLVPYLVAPVYQLKLVITGETYESDGRPRRVDGVIAVLATVYAVWVVWAGTADLSTFLLGVGLLVSGIVFYPWVWAERAKQRRGKPDAA